MGFDEGHYYDGFTAALVELLNIKRRRDQISPSCTIRHIIFIGKTPCG